MSLAHFNTSFAQPLVPFLGEVGQIGLVHFIERVKDLDLCRVFLVLDFLKIYFFEKDDESDKV